MTTGVTASALMTAFENALRTPVMLGSTHVLTVHVLPAGPGWLTVSSVALIALRWKNAR